MKVVIVAYAVSPYYGSEPGVGWSFLIEISKTHQVTAVVEEDKFREDIESYIRDNPCAQATSIEWVYIKRKRLNLLRKLWPPSYYWTYRHWHKKVFDFVKMRQDEFDLIHNLTMCGYREMGFLFRLKSKPWIWGPVGGTTNTPLSVLKKIHYTGFLYYITRNVWNYLEFTMNSRLNEISNRGNFRMISATKDVAMDFERFYGIKSIVVPEVACQESLKLPKQQNAIVWVGRLDAGKGLNILLRALATIERDFNLTIIGAGRLEKHFKQLTRSLGLEERVIFHGQVSRETVRKEIARSNIGVITSVKDLTSSVFMEYLGEGLSIIAPYYSGFKLMENRHCGELIKVHKNKTIIMDYARAIEIRLGNKDLLLSESINSVALSKRYSIENNVGKVLDLYSNLINEK